MPLDHELQGPMPALQAGTSYIRVRILKRLPTEDSGPLVKAGCMQDQTPVDMMPRHEKRHRTAMTRLSRMTYSLRCQVSW